jgi:ferric-dicitrate binding protein FerR (iron transport regulator)
MAILFSRREALLLATALTTGLPGAAIAGNAAGSVSDLIGEATASDEGATRALAVKALILLGDLVKTGNDSRLGLALGQRTLLRLGAETELRIERYIVDAGGELEFRQGTILFDHKGSKTRNDIRFNTPYGLIAVRGTRFLAGPSKGKFSVFVSRGKVEVSGGRGTVLLTSGLGTDFAQPGAAPSEPVAWKSARINELRGLVL